MNREDIIRIAHESYLDVYGLGKDYAKFADALERFAALVASAERERIKQANAPEIERINAHIKELEDAVKAEREACADIADKLPRTYRETKEAHERATLEPFHPSRFGFDFAELRQAEVITHAIRARGSHD